MSADNTVSDWKTVAGAKPGGWRDRAAADAGGVGLSRTVSSSEETRPSMDGWGRSGRSMPAAFGGGDIKRNDRLDDQRRRAADDADQKRKEERERADAKRHHERMMDFGNANEYPSLGGGAAAPAAKVVVEAAAVAVPKHPAHPMDFRSASERGAILAATLEAEEAARSRELYNASYAERMEEEERADRRRRLAQITTRCYDDGFDEHEPPEEEDDGGVVGHSDMPEHDEDESDDIREAVAGVRAAGEFNAHLAVTRRSGDKSNW